MRAVAPHITEAATALVLYVLQDKRCPEWKKDQLMEKAAKAAGCHSKQVGSVGDITIREDLERNLRSRGKVEYEIEAVEDVLIRWDRMMNES